MSRWATVKCFVFVALLRRERRLFVSKSSVGLHLQIARRGTKSVTPRHATRDLMLSLGRTTVAMSCASLAASERNCRGAQAG